MSSGRGQAILERRELLILLPVALVILVLLSTYTLVSYYSAVELLIEERRAEATQLARQVAVELAPAPVLPGADDLRRRWPSARNVTVLDASGQLVVGAALPEGSSPGRWPWSAGDGGTAAGTARFKRGSETLSVKVDLAMQRLHSRQRSLDVLTPVLLTVNVATTLLVLFIIRRFLAPFDRLVERARHAGQAVPESQDEVVFLVETFEKALEALARPPAAPQDVDELKALETTLTRSLESGVLLLDAEGQMLALNEIGASLLELEAAPVGQPLDAALGRHPPLLALLEGAIRRRQPVQRQECVVQVGEGERTLGVTAHPLRRDDAEIRGYLVMFADLTEAQRETRQRQLVDSLSQLGELTAGVAHELRNSLATLRGYLTLIDRDPDQESIADYLGEIRHESDHLQRVLEDFLMFARPGSTRPQTVDLLGLVHRAAADPTLGDAEVVVAADPDGGEGAASAFEVSGDPQLLERALRNVLKNAADAQREAGREDMVSVRLASRDGGVEVLVEDRGPGLSREVEAKLFDPFFSTRASGVGMGLALTRRIVLLHSGRITLENRERGGARASVWIPCGKIDTEGNKSRGRSLPARPAQLTQTADNM